MGNRYFEVLKRASSFLEERGVEGYSILYVFLERKGWSKTDWLIHLNEIMPAKEKTLLSQDVQRLSEHYPAQYLLGYTEFYGHHLSVTEATLIPRPETEELVKLCIQDNPIAELNVVDIGTGTGAIAISLKLANPSWQVTAVDISKEALTIAEKNAENLSTDILFIHGDGLRPFKDKKIDIIISNPPYVSENEWAVMDESVRKFEPKTALFADNNGLAVYQQLAKEAQNCLKEDGKIYLEIGFHQGASVQRIFQEAFTDHQVLVKKDLSGNDRMVIVLPTPKEE